MDHLENSYLIFTTPKYDYSIKKQIYSPKKVYVIDPDLINLISFKFSKDHGKLLENIVFLELRRIHSDIYYHRDKHGCDRIIQDNGHIINAIQVTATLNGNSKREYGGLLEALYKYDLDE